MVGFMISPEQLASAPAEVRRWIEAQIAETLTFLARIDHDGGHGETGQLAACTPEDALRVFELIKDDFLAAQVFFQFGREMSHIAGVTPLCALSIAEILRHTRLGSDRLLSRLEIINAAFQQVRRNPHAVLFGFDRSGNIIVHAGTHDSVRRIWQQLVAATASTGDLPQTAAPDPGIGTPNLAGPPLSEPQALPAEPVPATIRANLS